MGTKELREKRRNCKLWAEGRLDQADAEKDATRAKELRTEAESWIEQCVALTEQIEARERLEEIERQDVESEAKRDKEREKPDPEDRDDGPKDDQDLTPDQRPILERIASRGWPTEPFLERMGLSGLQEDRYAAYREAAKSGPFAKFSKPEYRSAFSHYVTGDNEAARREYRALQADDFVSGGALVAPMQMAAGIIQAADDMVFMRQFGTTQTVTSAASLGIASLDTDPSDPDWTTELGTGDEDSAMAFGGRELTPHPIAKRLKVSRKLLRMSPTAEAFVRARLGYKLGIALESAGLLGTGSQQPLGVFVASATGISTGRDVSSENTTTAMTALGLKNAKYTLKGNYWGRSRWMFHRDGVKQIAKLVDGEGRFLWEDQIRAGEPDRLLGFPVSMSENVPNTFTTGLYVGILGDFSNYWWVDALGMTIERLIELYAETNQVGFILRQETDAMPVLEEAFVRVTLA